MVLLPVVLLILLVVVLLLTLWWINHIRVSPTPIAMMATRIAFPGGLRLASVDRAIAQLPHPEEIAVPFDHAVLLIDYPLTTPATVKIVASIQQGFTRAELVRTICDEYADIYDMEEGTAQTKTTPVDERGEVKTRNRTDGVYGIYGHDLADLVLTAARWTRKSDGTVEIELFVEAA
jgi:hypothetical protein